MKFIASCSFGKDSLAMVLRILKDNLPLDDVIFYDTGMEFDSIYNNRDKMIKILLSKNINLSTLNSKNNFLFNMLIRPVKYRNSQGKDYPYHYGYEWCGGCARWGTSDKLSVIQNYYKEKYPGEEITEYIGIAADEVKRIGNNLKKGSTIKTYPLIDWKMTETDCLTFCRANGWDWNEVSPITESKYIDLYDILDRVSCWCCQNKNLKELKNIYMYLPEYWQRLRGLQSRIDLPMKGVGKSIFQLEERFKREIEMDASLKNREVQSENKI